MNTEHRTKINKLINNWQKGTISTTKYLAEFGIGLDLLKTYKKSKWIKSIGNRAFKLYDDTVEWYGGLYAIQNQLNSSIHPGGKTSLELTGYTHYLSNKQVSLYLFGNRGEKLPSWYRKYNWKINSYLSSNQLFSKTILTGLINYKYRDFEIQISSPERAIFEMLYHYPKYHSFDECFHVMENLVGLQPNICQILLEQCNSIKVKRMFLFLSDYADHHWLENLKFNNINLGKGNRSLVKNGLLNKKYQITVPEKYK